jgi:hypothetical protein
MVKRVAKKATEKTVKKASRQAGPGLSFGSVVDSVSRLHTEFLRQATHAVNVSLTLRNWLMAIIGKVVSCWKTRHFRRFSLVLFDDNSDGRN